MNAMCCEIVKYRNYVDLDRIKLSSSLCIGLRCIHCICIITQWICLRQTMPYLLSLRSEIHFDGHIDILTFSKIGKCSHLLYILSFDSKRESSHLNIELIVTVVQLKYCDSQKHPSIKRFIEFKSQFYIDYLEFSAVNANIYQSCNGKV